ncbi:MAG: hypothetical protein K2G25_07215 [Oscillospiraceae bacterium]|nr:hypothetical protein [Oscillospiraceae bacterium]
MKYRKYSDDELETMQKSVVSLTKRDLTGMVFGYAELNAGEVEFGVDYGGFSIILFDTGMVEVREYIFSQIPIEERLYSVPQSCISEIQQQYQKYHDETQIMYVPDNDSCDGAINYFYFGNHWVDVLNIGYSDIKEENEIMECFFSICEVLRKYDIVLDIDSVTVHGESTMTDSEVYAYEKGVLFWNVRIWCRKLFQKSGYFIRQFLKFREEKSVDKNKQK